MRVNVWPLASTREFAKVRLAHNVYFAALGNRSVVLDLERDRYIGLGADLTKATLQLIGRAPAEPAEPIGALRAARQALVARGILVDVSAEDRADRSFQGLLTPDATVWPTTLYGIGLSDLASTASVLGSLSEVQISLKTRAFSSTIDWLRREKRRVWPARARRSIQDLIDAYYAARPWFPIKPICRLDAIALCLYLWRNSREANLVFGVRLQPFAAHCWVQHGGEILNEPSDKVTRYTPIMII